MLPAGSAHTLRVDYSLGPPQSPPGGSYPPALTAAGPRLRLSFGFTDLVPARYLETGVPANLIYDQFAIGLELIVTGTAVAHRPITNGAVTTLGVNHWRVDYPSRFTAFSPMLEIRATDTLVASTRAVTLPVSGSTVTIEAIRLASSPTVDLNAALTNLASWLPANELAIGRYLHADRFTAFLIQGGMEYDGGCTATAELAANTRRTTPGGAGESSRPRSATAGGTRPGTSTTTTAAPGCSPTISPSRRYSCRPATRTPG